MLACALFDALKDILVFTFYMNCILMSFVQNIFAYHDLKINKGAFLPSTKKIKIGIFKKKPLG